VAAIVAEFPELSLADVPAAIAFYFDNRELIEADIARENAALEALRAQFPTKVQQKLASTDGNSHQISS
jgi:hypothetical protein